MVDGLIIPRSYNDYFSKSDPTAIRQLVGQYTDSALSSTSELPVQNKAVKGALDGITELIPAQATAQNQLADKGFVNSSVATNTANYISDNGDPFTSVAALEAYSGTVTNNDYAFVTGTDSDGNTYYDRYKATVSGSTVTWAKEYRLNNSSFTAAQWAAITSGITAAKVAQYDAAVNPIDDTQTLANKTWSSNKISGFANGVVTCATAAGTATKSITYPGFILQTGAVARVLFVNENSEANPTLRVNSETAVPIKALKGGTKIAPPVHNGKWRGASTATDETWQPYTQLDLMYDGTDFVILGNPLVEDGDTYSIYANGYNDFVNNCELSDYESVVIPNGAENATTALYDGIINIVCYGDNNRDTFVWVNGVKILILNYSTITSVTLSDGQTLFLNKGDTFYYTGAGSNISKSMARWYKLRDYSGR